jgi:hypothetical protein
MTTERAVIGIDPGSKGAAYLKTENGAVFVCYFQRLDRNQIRDVFFSWHMRFTIVAAYFEKTGVMPGDGAVTMRTAGENVGFIEGLCFAYFIKIFWVMPQIWQFRFNLGGPFDKPGMSKSQAKSARKNAHKAKANALFPTEKFTLETCDGRLITEYGWQEAFRSK